MFARNTDAGAAAGEAVLQRQFECLNAQMQDSDPRVRATAAKAVCHVLKGWWEAIPLATTKALLGRVVTQVCMNTDCAHLFLSLV